VCLSLLFFQNAKSEAMILVAEKKKKSGTVTSVLQPKQPIEASKWNGQQFIAKGLQPATAAIQLKEFQKLDVKLTDKGLVFNAKVPVQPENGALIVADGVDLPSKIK
jgi:hypothetical protein